MVKGITGICFWLGILGIVGGMEQGSIGIIKGFVICLILVIMSYLLCIFGEKKTSVVSGKHNGPAHSVLTKKLHRNYISKKGGVSSGI